MDRKLTVEEVARALGFLSILPLLLLVEMYSSVQSARQEVDPTPEHPNGRRTPPTKSFSIQTVSLLDSLRLDLGCLDFKIRWTGNLRCNVLYAMHTGESPSY